MQGFVDSGVTEFLPLMEFRNWLIELRDKPGYRSEVKRNNSLGHGPFLPSARRKYSTVCWLLSKKSAPRSLPTMNSRQFWLNGSRNSTIPALGLKLPENMGGA